MSVAPIRNDAPEGNEVPDIKLIMDRIRERVRAKASEAKGTSFVPTRPAESSGQRRAGELLHSEELRYLNGNYQFARLNAEAIQSHRPGLIGRVIVKCKRKILQLIWDGLLKEYFSNEREYQAHLVRFLNDIAKYTDARDAQNFWELVRKIDVDTTKAIERVERFADEAHGDVRRAERELQGAIDGVRRDLSGLFAGLESLVAALNARVATVESVAAGTETIVSRISVTTTSLERASESHASAPQSVGYGYLLLENRFRGSEEEIHRRLTPYGEIFERSSLPVLEVGGGRGELQKIFKERGVTSYMVDCDPAMIEAASASGCDARLGDGIAHLRGLPERSLAGVIALQVVEHLSREQLEEFIALAHSRVVSGGVVVFETINPQSVLALSSNYFRDPTHVFPRHPDTLRFQMDQAGFLSTEVRYLSPVPPEAMLREIPTSDFMPPQWEHAVSLLNHDISQLNALLYGYQDFCIIGRV
jgi:hypothetical protein